MLIKCIECRKEISHQAFSCPSCGWRIPEQVRSQSEYSLRSDLREKTRRSNLSKNQRDSEDKKKERVSEENLKKFESDEKKR